MKLNDTSKHNPDEAPFSEFIIRSGTHPHLIDGTQIVYKFPNGYGASVISGNYTYTDAESPFELAVLRFDKKGGWDIVYDTPVTEDTVGYLDLDGVYDVLSEIYLLKKDKVKDGDAGK
mgnify:CR=1 FL=1